MDDGIGSFARMAGVVFITIISITALAMLSFSAFDLMIGKLDTTTDELYQVLDEPVETEPTVTVAPVPIVTAAPVPIVTAAPTEVPVVDVDIDMDYTKNDYEAENVDYSTAIIVVAVLLFVAWLINKGLHITKEVLINKKEEEEV